MKYFENSKNEKTYEEDVETFLLLLMTPYYNNIELYLMCLPFSIHTKSYG